MEETLLEKARWEFVKKVRQDRCKSFTEILEICESEASRFGIPFDEFVEKAYWLAASLDDRRITKEAYEHAKKIHHPYEYDYVLIYSGSLGLNSKEIVETLCRFIVNGIITDEYLVKSGIDKIRYEINTWEKEPAKAVETLLEKSGCIFFQNAEVKSNKEF